MTEAPQTTRRAAAIHALIGVALALLGYRLANSYVSRLPDHRGLYLVAAPDRVLIPRAIRPRHALFVVVDGLRLDRALGMSSVRAVASRGRCARTSVGVPSVSRPVYTMLSTGLEQDRTGSRNNDQTAPVAVESIWEVAREAGLTVAGRSELAWWRELFPRGFDAYTVVRSGTNAFPAALTADVTLVHPVYVDDAGHDHGAASPEYARAVASVDRELGALLATMDLGVDLVVITADHGHTLRGGHGGDQPDVAFVLTCFAGDAGVEPERGVGVLDARSIAPALSMLLGLRLPHHVRAGDDDLDALFRIARAAPGDDGYLAERRGAVARYRAANAAQLRAWSDGATDRWPGFYARRRVSQWLRGGAVLLLAALAIAVLVRRASGLRARVLPLAFAALATALYLGVYALRAGGIDASSLNRKALFVRNALTASIVALVVASLLHAVPPRRGRDPLAFGGCLAVLALALNVAHLAAYGWPLGFPLPPPTLYFAPFLTSVWLLASGGYLAAIAAIALVRRPRA